jgi:hypothetical protein
MLLELFIAVAPKDDNGCNYRDIKRGPACSSSDETQKDMNCFMR